MSNQYDAMDEMDEMEGIIVQFLINDVDLSFLTALKNEQRGCK